MDNKVIKINFLDFPKSFDAEDCLFVRLLRKHFDVRFTRDADYVFYSVFGEQHWGVPDTCVKIFFTGENLVPDFNACDFAMGFDYIDYEDRYLRVPLYLLYGRDVLEKMETKHIFPKNWDLSIEKPDFCSFVVSNPINEARNAAFETLSKYKRVDSGGRCFNNVGRAVPDKVAFESSHKFSLCYENGMHNGYTTEKLIQAFAARTVPIYRGDPMVTRVFNPDAFINVPDYESFDGVIQRVKELDTNEELYLKMLRTPAMMPSAPTIEQQLMAIEDWLVDIFDRPLEQSYRRNREFHGRKYITSRQSLRVRDSIKKTLLSLVGRN